jgi:hypothetical protein
MNGFDLINRYKIEEYITAMSHAILFNEMPYHMSRN